MLDGGRAQVRASDAARGVHDPSWTETKVANLSTYTDVSFQEDPQPQPPAKFLDPPKVVKLVQQMKGASGGAAAKDEPQGRGTETPPQTSEPPKRPAAPERKVRTVVATTKSCDEFGPMVAADAGRRGFYEAKKKAGLGDGSLWIWGIMAFHFPGFEPILDFIHLLVHLYSAAQAAHKGSKARAWDLYTRLLKLAWAGKVAELEELLRKHSRRLGAPPENAADDDPRKILVREIDYVTTNQDKIDYPRYRRQGLPIFSAPVESLIKEVNIRVKGTDKFWAREGLEAVLQVRAAHLSDDGRQEAFWAKRPLGRAAGRSLFRGGRAA